jgi:hypothetical protein
MTFNLVGAFQKERASYRSLVAPVAADVDGHRSMNGSEDAIA